MFGAYKKKVYLIIIEDFNVLKIGYWKLATQGNSIRAKSKQLAAIKQNKQGIQNT